MTVLASPKSSHVSVAAANIPSTDAFVAHRPSFLGTFRPPTQPDSAALSLNLGRAVSASCAAAVVAVVVVAVGAVIGVAVVGAATAVAVDA